MEDAALGVVSHRDGRPKVVVLDLVLGREVGGTTFLAKLKAGPATGDVPGVVCNAYTWRLKEFEEQLGVRTGPTPPRAGRPEPSAHSRRPAPPR